MGERAISESPNAEADSERNGGDDFWLRGVSRGAKVLVDHLFIIQLFQRNGTPSDM